MEEPEVLTITEAAAYLRVTTITVRRMIQRGELNGTQIGSAWRIRRSDVDALFTSRK